VKQAEKSQISRRSFGALDAHLIVAKFYHLAAKSLFFSRINCISALRRGPDGQISSLWHVRGHRSDRNEKFITNLALELREGGGNQPKEEQWLIATSRNQEEIPAQFKGLARRHRLPVPSVSMAIPIFGEQSGTALLDSRLFATLPLPIATSLPIHLHARWVLSSDRRSIHYVAADANGGRPLESLYNDFLLSEIIPSLYFDALAVVAPLYPDQVYRYWPTKAADGISAAVIQAFFKYFITAEQRVCRTVTGEWIAPKDAIFHTAKSYGVRLLLAKLQLPHFVETLPCSEQSPIAWENLRVDSADETAHLLRQRSRYVQRIFDSNVLNSSDIKSILRHLIDGKSDLVGIPLLLLADGSVEVFCTPDDPPVFSSNLRDIAKLFGPKRVIGSAIADDKHIVEALLEAHINVRNLDLSGIRQLFAQCPAKIVPKPKKGIRNTEEGWLTAVLQFLHNLDSIKLADLDDLPLIPTKNGNIVVSADYVEQNPVLWQSMLTEFRCPTTALIKLGVIIIDDKELIFLSPSLTISEVITTILSALSNVSAPGVSRQAPDEEWSNFAEWLGSNVIPSDIDQISVNILRRLRLFLGQRATESRMSLWAAQDLTMLPTGLSEAAFLLIKQYLPSTIKFALFSPILKAIFRRFPGNSSTNNVTHELTPEALLGLLRIPATISETRDHTYLRVIDLFISWHPGEFNDPLIPNQNRQISRPNEMYDHRVPVFANAFQGRSDRFVHEAYRVSPGFLDSLVDLGVRKDIRSEELMACVNALHEDAENDILTTERANDFWDYFNSRNAPSIIQLIDFEQICNLRFVPCTNLERHSHFPSFANPLPSVVSPKQVVLHRDLPVMWTQRASFTREPSHFLPAIMPLFGVPTAVEVVRFLRYQEIPSIDFFHSGVTHGYTGDQNCPTASCQYSFAYRHQGDI
jgi:hypothetical protein